MNKLRICYYCDCELNMPGYPNPHDSNTEICENCYKDIMDEVKKGLLTFEHIKEKEININAKKQINHEKDKFCDNLKQLMSDFKKNTGCYIESIELDHKFHLNQYEKTSIKSISLGMIHKG